MSVLPMVELLRQKTADIKGFEYRLTYDSKGNDMWTINVRTAKVFFKPPTGLDVRKFYVNSREARGLHLSTLVEYVLQ